MWHGPEIYTPGRESWYICSRGWQLPKSLMNVIISTKHCRRLCLIVLYDLWTRGNDKCLLFVYWTKREHGYRSAPQKSDQVKCVHWCCNWCHWDLHIIASRITSWALLPAKPKCIDEARYTHILFSSEGKLPHHPLQWLSQITCFNIVVVMTTLWR